MSEAAPIENLVTPFMLESGHVRGRIARLGDVANTILSRYNYPTPVIRLLGELLLVAGMLSANLKQTGILTIQIRGKGLVPLVVVDAVYGGDMRGYAEVPEESYASILALNDPAPSALVGEGAYLAITLDAGGDAQRYQGIVALEGASIAEAMTNYFTHSQQIEAEMTLAVSESAPWVAAGAMIERLPESGDAEANLESWRYARAVTGTITRDELLDPLLDASTLLYRLFHEEGVRVFPAHRMNVGCRCSRPRIQQLLMSMSATDRADMVVEGQASVHCQFCNKAELFTPAELGLSVN